MTQHKRQDLDFIIFFLLVACYFLLVARYFLLALHIYCTVTKFYTITIILYFFFCYLLDQLNNFLKMALENKTLLLKDFEYSITLRGLSNEQSELKNLHGETCFLIKTNDIFKFFRRFDTCVKNEIGVVCSSNVPCHSHAAHGYLKHLTDEIINYVENEKLYYKAFYFRRTKNNDVALAGWTAEPVQPICLKHLSYSRRLAYLN